MCEVGSSNRAALVLLLQAPEAHEAVQDVWILGQEVENEVWNTDGFGSKSHCLAMALLKGHIYRVSVSHHCLPTTTPTPHNVLPVPQQQSGQRCVQLHQRRPPYKEAIHQLVECAAFHSSKA